MLPPHLRFPLLLGKTIHLGVCGSVAAYKAAVILRDLLDNSLRVTVTLTEAANRFISPLTFASLGAETVYGPMFDDPSGPFGHLQPGAEADAMLIAPASADMLGKLACGLANDMLSCQAMAFGGPMLLAPAMNPRMWASLAVRENWSKLLDRGAIGIEPEPGPMACGEIGQGRLACLELIQAMVLRAVSPGDMAGKRVLVNLGPTREFWDSARFWSNPSTGLMGAAMAMAAWLRGADVEVVAGPSDWWLPPQIKVTPVVTAKEMFEACLEAWPRCDAAAATAAVSDFTPVPYAHGKYKKDAQDSVPLIKLARTRDILYEMGRIKRPGQFLIGFAAEAADIEIQARQKLERKNCDLVAGNPIGPAAGGEAGFASTTNRLVVVERSGRVEEWPLLSKTEVAWKLWNLAAGQ